jgi:hypothetical protein
MTDRPEPPHCDLCGHIKKCSVALLREPWSNARVTVHVCNACSARAWRTIKQPAPVEIDVPDDVPVGLPVAAAGEGKRT